MVLLRKYNAAATINFPLFNTDGKTFKADATFAAGDVTIMKDEGAEANTTNLPTDEGKGYSLALTATEMQAARIVIYVKDQDATPLWLDAAIIIDTYGNASAQHEFDLDTAIGSSSVASVTGAVGSVTGNVGGNVVGSVGSVTGAVGSVTGNVGGNVVGSVGSIGSGGITSASFGAGAVNAAAIAADALGASELAADAAAEIAAAVGTIPSAAAIADAVWDELRSGHVTAGTFGERVLADVKAVDGDTTAATNLAKFIASRVLRANTLFSGGAGSVTLDAGAAATTDWYKHCHIAIVSGTGAGQIRCITAYNSSRQATVKPNFITAPDGTSGFVIVGTQRQALQDYQSYGADGTPAVNTIGYVLGLIENSLYPDLVLNEGTSVAVAAGSLTLAAAASAINTAYVGAFLVMIDGTGKHQIRKITAYNGGTKVATIDSNWGTNPTAGDRYAVMASAAPISTITSQDIDITRTGTAQAGAATTITLDAGASAVNDFYKDQIIALTGGTGAGQSKIITGYVGSTKVATVNSAWATNPDATSIFALRAMGAISGASAPTAAAVADAVWDELRTDHSTANTMGAALGDVRADVRNKKESKQNTREVRVYEDDGVTQRFERTLSNPDSNTVVATPS